MVVRAIDRFRLLKGEARIGGGEMVNVNTSSIGNINHYIFAFKEPQISRFLSDPIFMTVHKLAVLFTAERVDSPGGRLGSRGSQTVGSQGRAWAPKDCNVSTGYHQTTPAPRSLDNRPEATGKGRHKDFIQRTLLRRQPTLP